MKRITKISLIAAGALVVVSSFTACSHFRSPENRADWMVERVTDKLELTESQQGKLKALKDEMMTARKDMKLKFGDSREQMVALFDQPTIDQGKALNIIKSHTQMVEERAPVMVSTFADFYDSLDSEQQREVREFMQKHDDRHHRWGPHRFFSHN